MGIYECYGACSCAEVYRVTLLRTGLVECSPSATLTNKRSYMGDDLYVVHLTYCVEGICSIQGFRAYPLPAAFLFSGVLGGLNIGLISTFTQPDRSRALESDEFEEVFEEQAIGIELQDVRNQTWLGFASTTLPQL